MPATITASDSSRYARTIEASRRVRWDIDADVIRGRSFDSADGYLPDTLSLAGELDLNAADRRFYGQVLGRTYAAMFGLVERFIGAKMLDLGRDHALGDQAAFEAIVRFTDEELKHQALFRRIETMIGAGMPPGWRFVPGADDVAAFVLGKSTWAVLGLTCHIELFSLAHYRAAIADAAGLSPLFKDIFRCHWQEESQHVVVDELEWQRADRALADDTARDAAVDDLIALVGGVDGILQAQAEADAGYFLRHATGAPDAAAVGATVLKSYRWQYIVSGAVEPRFQTLLRSLTTPAQLDRILAALAPLLAAAPRH